MKKALFLILVLTFLCGAPLVAIAEDSSSSPVQGRKMPELQMTAEQKAQMISLKTQILELKKQIIKYNLEKGVITVDQAKKMEDRINAKLEALKSGKLGPHRKYPPRVKP